MGESSAGIKGTPSIRPAVLVHVAAIRGEREVVVRIVSGIGFVAIADLEIARGRPLRLIMW